MKSFEEALKEYKEDEYYKDVDVHGVYYCSRFDSSSLNDICGGVTDLDEDTCIDCGEPVQESDRVIVDWSDLYQLWPTKKEPQPNPEPKPVNLKPKAELNLKIMKTEEYISILFKSLKTGTKKSLHFFVKELRPGKCEMMFYHIGVMYVIDPKLVLLFCKEMYWFCCRLYEQSIILNLSDENKSNSQYLKSLVRSVNEVKKSVRIKYADYLLNSSWARKSVFDLIKGQLQKPKDKNYLNLFEAYNIEYIEDELKNYLDTNKSIGYIFDYRGSAIFNYIRENFKNNYGVVEDGFMDKVEILERSYVEDPFTNIRQYVLSNIGPWPDLKQSSRFENRSIEDVLLDTSNKKSIISTSDDNLEEELKKLKSLFDKKLLNEDEYKLKKKQLLGL